MNANGWHAIRVNSRPLAVQFLLQGIRLRVRGYLLPYFVASGISPATAWSVALKAVSPPWLVQTRMAKFRFGATQTFLWLSPSAT